jgi:hypothetical protein
MTPHSTRMALTSILGCVVCSPHRWDAHHFVSAIVSSQLVGLNPHRPHYHKFVIDRIPPIFDEIKAQQNIQFLRTNFIRI